ncbi:MAG TPA: diguanylate cyclase, partial [Rhodocyclaceae bacterium]|nr:diguanylate cyclase [Rhodocyclaceae bacterium]
MQTFFPATRLAYRLLIRVLLVCLIFAVLIGGLFSYLTYREQIESEEKKLVDLQRGLLAPLAEDVWALDEPGIRLQLDAISRILPSAAIQLTTLEDRSYTDGRPMPASDSARTHHLPLFHPRSSTPLGTLSITLDTAVIRAQVREQMISDAVALLGLTLVISLTLGFFVYHLIVRRLTIVSRFARTLDLDALDRSTLHLPVPAKKQDELDDLTEAIERMRQRISQDMLTARAMQRELSYQASHDPLTGLGNRSYLSTRSTELLKPVNGPPEIAFVFLDIDRFKLINDTLGHLVGDHLLRALADRIRANLPPRAELFRPGSDEFLLLVPEPSAHPSVRDIIRQLQESLAAPFEIELHALSVTISIGVAVAPDNGSELSTLLKHTDIALQAAKQAGRNHACFFTPDLLARLNDQVKIETLLRGALDRNEFHLVYQPQIDIASGRVVGAEALLRWENDALGKVPPDRFIPVAEDTGLIIPIGAWVLRQAIIEWRRWQQRGLLGIPVSVNLSAAQLRHAELLDAIRDLCQEESMPPEALELEVTESI